MDLAIAIWRLAPRSEYTLADDKTDIAEWWDGTRPRPTRAELQSAWDGYVAERAGQQAAADAVAVRRAQAKSSLDGVAEFKNRTWSQIAAWIDATWPTDPVKVVKVLFRLLFYVVKHSDIED